MSAAEHLDDYLTEYGAPFDDANGNPPASHWVVDSPDRAEWALRKLTKIRRQQQQNTMVADEVRRRTGEWLDKVNGTLDGEARFFEGLLTQFHRGLLEDDPERKTVSFPAGVLRARQLPDQWTFTDDFTDWAAAHRPDLIRTKVDVDRAAAKKQLEALSADAVVDTMSGEKVPGVHVERGDIKFTVTVDGSDL